jgi:uncharacterized protein
LIHPVKSDDAFGPHVANSNMSFFYMNIVSEPNRTDRASDRNWELSEMSIRPILLTGSSGLVGASLVRSLREKQISTLILQRQTGKIKNDEAVWDPYAAEPVKSPETLEGITAAVHLSGANLAAHRWTSPYKRVLRASRVTPTRSLATLLAGLRSKPSVLICASAVGIYGDRADELLTETSSPGSGFLAELCLAWEKAAQPAVDAGIRVVHLRFGVALSAEGGALARMLPVFRAGVGGRLGNGEQWMSWIALPDVVRVIEFALQTASLSGPVNLVAPNPVTNSNFTRILGRVLHRPAVIPAPAVALRLALGEMADEAILASQRAAPARLNAAGFVFQYPELEACLRGVLPSA